MDIQLYFILSFTFIINLLGTFAYSTRIAGIKTNQLAISFAMFNVMILISRLSNSFQAPLLAKRVEENLTIQNSMLENDFRLIILSATFATIIGIVMTPTFQRFLTKIVYLFAKFQSIPRMIIAGVSYNGFMLIKNSLKMPNVRSIKDLLSKDKIPFKYLLFNMLATAMWTVGVLASIYAGYLNPELRVTSSQLSSIINGFATIMLVILIDPRVALITDEVSKQIREESYLQRTVFALMISRLFGTLLAQILFTPSAKLIAYIANII